ncbi:hypothetical protein D1820_02605 [Phaeobacter sp. LSS9]|nr:hypothetical protein D1820_02605 [Phaeobacter sp. LSS9]
MQSIDEACSVEVSVLFDQVFDEANNAKFFLAEPSRFPQPLYGIVLDTASRNRDTQTHKVLNVVVALGVKIWSIGIHRF